MKLIVFLFLPGLILGALIEGIVYHVYMIPDGTHTSKSINSRATHHDSSPDHRGPTLRVDSSHSPEHRGSALSIMGSKM